MAKSARLGRWGTYKDSSGFQKAATVIGTRESVQDGTDVTRPDEGRVNVLIYKPGSGETYTRFNVPVGEGACSFSF